MDADPQRPAAAEERILVFELDHEAYALRVSTVSGLAACGAIRRVPRAPASVLGLTEWRGDLLVVLDLPRLLRRPGGDEPGCLVRLAPPWQQSALLLPLGVRMASAALPIDPVPVHTDVESIVTTTFGPDSRAVRLIALASLLRGLQLDPRERS
jgi:hypothetical protein